MSMKGKFVQTENRSWLLMARSGSSHELQTDTRELLGVMEMFYNWTVVMMAQLYKCPKIIKLNTYNG